MITGNRRPGARPPRRGCLTVLGSVGWECPQAGARLGFPAHFAGNSLPVPGLPHGDVSAFVVSPKAVKHPHAASALVPPVHSLWGGRPRPRPAPWPAFRPRQAIDPTTGQQVHWDPRGTKRSAPPGSAATRFLENQVALGLQPAAVFNPPRERSSPASAALPPLNLGPTSLVSPLPRCPAFLPASDPAASLGRFSRLPTPPSSDRINLQAPCRSTCFTSFLSPRCSP